jgi:hypothetical protein
MHFSLYGMADKVAAIYQQVGIGGNILLAENLTQPIEMWKRD